MSQPIEHLIDAAVKPVPPPDNPGGLPYPTHAGHITIAGLTLKVYVLNTGQRIIDAADLEAFLGKLTGGET